MSRLSAPGPSCRSSHKFRRRSCFHTLRMKWMSESDSERHFAHACMSRTSERSFESPEYNLLMNLNDYGGAEMKQNVTCFGLSKFRTMRSVLDLLGERIDVCSVYSVCTSCPHCMSCVQSKQCTHCIQCSHCARCIQCVPSTKHLSSTGYLAPST